MKRLRTFINYETISYLFFGGLTTIVGFGSFVVFMYIGFNTTISNTISTILAVLFAYFTNKIFVFKSKGWGFWFTACEIAKFCSGRFVMFAAETLLLILLIDLLGFNSTIMKAFTMTLVVAGNYCFSKWIVFKKKT